MKKKNDGSPDSQPPDNPVRPLATTELADLRRAFSSYDLNAKQQRIEKIDGCRVEINHTKGTILVIKGNNVIVRVVGVPNDQLNRVMKEVRCQPN